ncbi:MAG: hypothetical protein AMS17_11045 [Spirochaetes bacterium DG_61]|jgi:excisionase family DNA binding protein|nr:MAG: hypothetical protein AMS17_11045 [Spirochaetes bacterium DG_61]
MEKLLDIREAANILSLKTKTLYAYIHKRRIPFVKLGARVLFDPERLQNWVKERSVEPIK